MKRFLVGTSSLVLALVLAAPAAADTANTWVPSATDDFRALAGQRQEVFALRTRPAPLLDREVPSSTDDHRAMAGTAQYYEFSRTPAHAGPDLPAPAGSDLPEVLTTTDDFRALMGRSQYVAWRLAPAAPDRVALTDEAE